MTDDLCEHSSYVRAETETTVTETCRDCGEVFTTKKEKPKPEAEKESEVMPPEKTTQATPQAENLPAARQADNTPLGVIESHLRTKQFTQRLTLALGFTSGDEKGKSEAFKYISSVLAEIQKTAGDSKKDLTRCSPDSIVRAVVDAASFRMPIDGRQLAYLVKYGNVASFQPGYKGYLYKVAEMYRDVDFTAEPVFEGDELKLNDTAGFQTYTHVRSDPFQQDQTKLRGIIACLSYSGEGGRHSKVVTLPHDEIKRIRGVAKQDSIWKAWFFEKAKGAALKRLCKIHFTTAQGLQELIKYDNEQHYNLKDVTPENGITPAKPSEKLREILEEGEPK